MRNPEQSKFFSATVYESSKQIGITFQHTPSLSLRDLRELITDLEELKAFAYKSFHQKVGG